MSTEQTENEPYTWQKLKEFCDSLSAEQLQQNVVVIQEDSILHILTASQLGEDHYKFEDEDYSFTKDDFDAEIHLEGKYETLEQALENEPFTIVPATIVYLYEDF